MLAEAIRHEAIANNLANVSTVGFKRDTALVQQHPVQQLHRTSDHLINFNGLRGLTVDLAPVIGSRGQGALVEMVATNFSQGSMLETGNPMDLALQGEGFFTIDTFRGRRYTRQGNFAVDGRGRLVTQSGDPVLTTTGSQVYVGDREFEVSSDGLFFLDGVETGRIGIVTPQQLDMLIKEGAGLFAAAPGARFQVTGATLSQGFLERSNVNPIMEMSRMMQALRAYEANQKAVTAQDQTLDTLISQVGRFG